MKIAGYVLVVALTLLIAVLVGFALFETYQYSHQMCGGGAQDCSRPS